MRKMAQEEAQEGICGLGLQVCLGWGKQEDWRSQGVFRTIHNYRVMMGLWWRKGPCPEQEEKCAPGGGAGTLNKPHSRGSGTQGPHRTETPTPISGCRNRGEAGPATNDACLLPAFPKRGHPPSSWAFTIYVHLCCSFTH